MSYKSSKPFLFNKFDGLFCRFGDKNGYQSMRLQPRKSLFSILPSTSK